MSHTFTHTHKKRIRSTDPHIAAGLKSHTDAALVATQLIYAHAADMATIAHHPSSIQQTHPETALVNIQVIDTFAPRMPVQKIT